MAIRAQHVSHRWLADRAPYRALLDIMRTCRLSAVLSACSASQRRYFGGVIPSELGAMPSGYCANYIVLSHCVLSFCPFCRVTTTCMGGNANSRALEVEP